MIRRATRRPDEAASFLGRAVAANPGDATAQNNYGNVLRDLKRFDEALASYDRALSLKSDYAEVHNNRGNALRDLQRFEDAIGSYRKALDCDPGLLRVYQPLAELLNSLGRTDEAAAHRCLGPKGVFAFTVEALPEGISSPFKLTMTAARHPAIVTQAEAKRWFISGCLDVPE